MANVKHNALTAAKVKMLAVAGTYTDGGGLTLRVSDTGAKKWVLRLTIDGKARNIGLGGYPAVRLKEARELADSNRQAIRRGRNPIEEKQQAREYSRREASIPTFQQAAQTVMELRRPTWSSDRHAKQWTESLTNHAFPLIGRKTVNAVTTADVTAVLTPIWTDKAETATRVRQRMEKVFDFAIVQGWRSDNPANGTVTAALPRRPRLKAHHPALAYEEAPAALGAVRESTADTTTRLAFQYMVLTAARAVEVREADWSEIDIEARMWSVPAARMKARREHRVPLSDRAVAVLLEAKAITGGEGLIFPAKRSGKAQTNMAFAMLLRRLGIDAVPHGFRSSFRDWTIAETSTPWAVGEAALAHNLGNSVEAAYARHDLFERRRGLMQEWADFLTC